MSKETLIQIRTEMSSYTDDLKKINDKIARLLAQFAKDDLGRMSNPEKELSSMLSEVPEGMQKDVLMKALVILATTTSSNSGNHSKQRNRDYGDSEGRGFWG